MTANKNTLTDANVETIANYIATEGKVGGNIAFNLNKNTGRGDLHIGVKGRRKDLLQGLYDIAQPLVGNDYIAHTDNSVILTHDHHIDAILKNLEQKGIKSGAAFVGA